MAQNVKQDTRNVLSRSRIASLALALRSSSFLVIVARLQLGKRHDGLYSDAALAIARAHQQCAAQRVVQIVAVCRTLRQSFLSLTK